MHDKVAKENNNRRQNCDRRHGGRNRHRSKRSPPMPGFRGKQYGGLKRGHKPLHWSPACYTIRIMARKPRFSPGGLAYHVMNRTWGKLELFQDAGDYQAFERVLVEALEREPMMRLCRIA